VINPDRVGQLVCVPGERVRVELGFRWDAEPQAVVADFRKFVGSRFSARNLGKQIRLEGRKIRHVTEDEAYMSVILEGVIPGSIAPGNYYCKFVHFLSPGGKWILVFENLELAIKVVNSVPAHRERRSMALRDSLSGLNLARRANGAVIVVINAALMYVRAAMTGESSTRGENPGTTRSISAGPGTQVLFRAATAHSYCD
jgi:hypothetical protein